MFTPKYLRFVSFMNTKNEFWYTMSGFLYTKNGSRYSMTGFTNASSLTASFYANNHGQQMWRTTIFLGKHIFFANVKMVGLLQP